MEKEKLEKREHIDPQERKLDQFQKIRNLINEGNFIGLLPFLSKEDREDFIDVVTETMDEKNSGLFWRKLEQSCMETLEEAEQRRALEDIQSSIALEDLKRSQLNADFRHDMTQQISDLKTQNANGDFLTLGDKYFLEKHDERAYNNSEQQRKNAARQEDYSVMNDLGYINAVGDNNVNKSRILAAINNVIRQKQEFLAHGGDLKNSQTNFDQQLGQLYSALADVEKMEETLQTVSPKR